MKKKIFTIAIAVLLLAATVVAFAACNNDKPDGETVKINIVVPDGAPALAVSKLIAEGSTYQGYELSYEVVPGATEISAKIMSGEADFAIAPTNLAAVLFNKNAGVEMLSASTYGNLYLVGKTDYANINVLVGSIVLIIGQGGTPDLSFRYILDQKGIAYETSDTAIDGKVALRYVASGSELIPLLKQDKAQYGILGEPAVSQAMGAIPGLKRLAAIHDLWSEVTGGKAYVQAVFIGKSSVVDANAEFVSWLLNKLAESVDWIKENPVAAQDAIKSVGSTLTVTFTTASVTASNIRYVSASAAKADTAAYLQVLASFDAKNVGGSVPGDAFYHAA